MNHPFDDFSKSLAGESVSRRESLRRLGATLTGALVAPLLIGVEMASANPDNRRRRRRAALKLPFPRGGGRDACSTFCNTCSKSKRDQCFSACRACNNDPKRLKGSCGNYVCCNSGQSYCSGRCVDFNTDPNNCGSCGHVCGAGTQCINGTCSEIVCPSGLTKCGSTCVALSLDNNNCGTCGNVCCTGTSCINGTCTNNGELCEPGLTHCFYGCTNLMTDPRNCGACGHQCGSGDGCSGGICTGICVGC